MSQDLINLNSDLCQLRREGYEVFIKEGHLLVSSIPYVTASREVKRGTLVSTLDLSGDKTIKPTTHVAFFIGAQPCFKDGTCIDSIIHSGSRQKLSQTLEVDRSFSNKFPGGYANYYQKMTRYISIISAPAASLQPGITAKTFVEIEKSNDDSIFAYGDTNSTKANIRAVSDKLAKQRIGIIGVGGTGSYLLDLISKTPVQEIHLFDGDYFYQNNAFRSPGAASKAELEVPLMKVEYHKRRYSIMHLGIKAVPQYISQANVTLLTGLGFVFLCLDKGTAKTAIVEYLELNKIPFIDVGIGVQKINDALIGTARVTASTEDDRKTFYKHVSLANDDEDDLYSSNIQIADLNMLNAALAVIKWKKILGFYCDQSHEVNSVYTLTFNNLTNEETDD